MRFLKASLTAALLGSTALAASADDHKDNDYFKENGWFVAPHVGYLFDNEEAYGGLAIGKQWEFYDFYLQFQTGAEDGDFSGDDGIDDVDLDLDSYSLSVGGAFNGHICKGLSYYLGGSVGLAFIDGENDNGDSNEEVFFFDVKAGLQYHFTEHFALQTGLRYIYLDDYESGGLDTDSTSDIGYELGLKFRF